VSRSPASSKTESRCDQTGGLGCIELTAGAGGSLSPGGSLSAGGTSSVGRRSGTGGTIALGGDTGVGGTAGGAPVPSLLPGPSERWYCFFAFDCSFELKASWRCVAEPDRPTSAEDCAPSKIFAHDPRLQRRACAAGMHRRHEHLPVRGYLRPHVTERAERLRSHVGIGSIAGARVWQASRGYRRRTGSAVSQISEARRSCSQVLSWASVDTRASAFRACLSLKPCPVSARNTF
jgi:hypothetical protein